MKKILYISPNGYLGGAERFVLNACLGHKKYGKYHSQILFFNEGEFVDIAKDKEIDVLVLKNKFRLRYPFRLLKAILEIRKLVKENNISAINCTMPYSQVVMSLSFLKKPLYWFQHGPVGGKLDLLASYTKYKMILFNTRYLEKAHSKTALINKRKDKEFINYAIMKADVPSGQSIKEVREKYILSDEEYLILAAGRICEWKGYETLIHAVSLLKISNPEYFNKLKVVIVGSAKQDSDREYEKKLINLIESLELKDKIELQPFVQNIEDYYCACDLFIHCSTIPEPFGLVVAEAMLGRAFVIGSSQGGVSDILINLETGLTFDSTNDENSSESLTECLKQFFEMRPDKAEKIINTAYNKINKNYNIVQMIDQLESLYDEKNQ